MANNETNYSAVSLPKDFIEEVRADADELTKQQNRLKSVSLSEMIVNYYRAHKQGTK